MIKLVVAAALVLASFGAASAAPLASQLTDSVQATPAQEDSGCFYRDRYNRRYIDKCQMVVENGEPVKIGLCEFTGMANDVDCLREAATIIGELRERVKANNPSDVDILVVDIMEVEMKLLHFSGRLPGLTTQESPLESSIQTLLQRLKDIKKLSDENYTRLISKG